MDILNKNHLRNGLNRTSIIALTLVLAACGSGGGGGNGDTNSNGFTPPSVSGLGPGADNQDLLFFTSAVNDNRRLFAVDPAYPEDPPADLNVAINDTSFTHSRNFFPIQQADWDASAQTISDFHIDRVLFFNKFGIDQEGVYTVSTEAGTGTTPTPERITSLNALSLDTRALFTYSLENADQTALIYKESDDWKQIQLGDDTSTDPLVLDSNLVPVFGSWDPQTAQGDGWMVVDTSDATLKMVDMNLQPVSGTVTHNGSPVSGIEENESGMFPWATSVQQVGSTFSDGSRFLAIASEYVQNDGLYAELWHYTPGNAGEPGTAKPLHNTEGETLTFSPGILSAGAPVVPGQGQMVVVDDTIFFIQTEGLFGFESKLFRADPDGWSEIAFDGMSIDFLIAADNRVAWIANDELVSRDKFGNNEIVVDADVIDYNAGQYGQSLEGQIRGSRNGWVFYNRTESNQQDSQDFAVAATLDGNNSIAIPNARWIGASSSGQGTADVTLDAQELGEVFLLRNGTELAAVNAADPAAGMVTLGTLPSGAVDATLFGLAPGPHRLLQVEIDGSPASYEVIYVNTNQEDSLVTVSSQAHQNGQLMRPLQGF
ncbi:MAG TPA: hypothetical protein VFN16_08210 [Saccharospirillum sp.]|nr:hypothetical protein [Saccharospirillum sp.]